MNSSFGLDILLFSVPMVVSNQVQVILAEFLILFTLSFSPIHMFLIRGTHMRHCYWLQTLPNYFVQALRSLFHMAVMFLFLDCIVL